MEGLLTLYSRYREDNLGVEGLVNYILATISVLEQYAGSKLGLLVTVGLGAYRIAISR